MSEFSLNSEISADNLRSLKVLIRSVNLASEFNLILVHCNYRCLRRQAREWLDKECPAIRVLELPNYGQSLDEAIKMAIGEEQPQALNVYNLETVYNLGDFLAKTNQVRDKFKKSFPFALLLWITDEVQRNMARIAPDFYSFDPSPVELRLPSAELLAFLHHEEKQLFDNIIKGNSEDLIKGKYRPNFLLRQEVESALRDLPKDGCDLEPELEASLQFALGQDDYGSNNINQAIEKYSNSLIFWQESNNLTRQGILSFYLGLCYLRQAELNRAESESHWETADSYFQQALAAFTEGELPELKAKFISYRGEVLKSLKRWEELNNLVQESLQLHRVYNNPLELARDYGFLAEIALNKNNSSQACEDAKKALEILQSIPDSEQYQGQYLLSLAQGQKNLSQSSQAIATLIQASKSSQPNQNPQLYIAILEALSKVYFEEKEYLKAFQFKQEQRAIKNQYGFLAFIGAGCLQSPHQLNSNGESLPTVAQEIAVSGRQKDVKKLMERIKDNQYALTIIHGQLGVGKSSTIKAGLIPSLQQKMFDARDVMPICLQAYTKWSQKLGKELVKQLVAYQKISPETINSIPEIEQQLRKNDEQNLFTVLIFDQFEEFFFVNKTSTERKEFFRFLSSCINISFVKIILSLREDYLHYLLEWERYNNLDAINGDILTKSNRYELRNFSVQDAKNIMQTLTQNSQFDLESGLIKQVVADLAGKEGEIRPIELQVVGAELQSKKITTLAKYQELEGSPKERLVESYLERVIENCGEENEEAARIVLYLLTGENDTRPTKTRAEIEIDLRAVEKDLSKQADKLDLVLGIFQQSGLIFLLPELPANRYQLVHDYLVSFIRKKQPKIDELVRELQEKRQKLELTEGRLRISELERKISEDNQRFVKEQQKSRELEIKLLEKEKSIILRNFVLVIALVVIPITLCFAYRYNDLENYNDNLEGERKALIKKINNLREGNKKRIASKENEILQKSYQIADFLLDQNNLDRALIEIIIAGYQLENTFDKNDKIFYLGGKVYETTQNGIRDYSNTPQKVIGKLQEVMQKYLFQEKRLTRKEKDYLGEDIDNLKPVEQYLILTEFLQMGCKYTTQELWKQQTKQKYCVD